MMYVERVKLEALCAGIFRALGIPEDEAAVSAEILAAADARGIRSHGVARMQRYAAGIKAGMIKGGVEPETLHESPLSFVWDAGGGMGQPVSRRAMEKVIAIAAERGVGVGCVRNSNHFGIAGYYSEMAARRGMIGIAMTNTAALGVPTNARKAMFGTNPIAFAAPAADGRLFSLDMATTAVPRGKIEVCGREGKPVPPGWAVGTDGLLAADPGKLLEDMLYQRGGGLLPLGGEGEKNGGHKGYGLAVMVDILTALCSGGAFGEAVRDSAETSARVCHFFMAFDINIFRPADDFKKDLSVMLDSLAALPPAEGAGRVYYAGQKEQEAEAESLRRGVPLEEKVWESLRRTAAELGAE